MEWVIIAVVLVVVAIAAVVGYVVPRRRRGVEPTVEAPTLEPAESAPSATEAETVPEVAAEPVVETPEPTAGRLVRLLSRSQSTLGKGLLALLSRDRLDDDTWEEIEDSLITADVGVGATGEIVSRLREQTRVLGTRSAAELRELLSAELINAIGADTDRTLATAPHPEGPAVVLVVGVNGTGKTTTCGKLARVLVADGRTVLLGAA